MTLSDFFLAVNTAGIRLVHVGGRLQFKGPTETVTPQIRDGAAEHEAAILGLLPTAPTPQMAEIKGPATTPSNPGGQVRKEAEPGEGFRHDHD